MSAPGRKALWTYALERDRVRARRAAGAPEPWTDDEALRRFHFPNVRRADDKGTAFIVALAKAKSSPADLLWLAYSYRALNSQRTAERLGLPARNRRSLAAWTARVDADVAMGIPVGSGKHITMWQRTREALPRLLEMAPRLAREVLFAADGVEASKALMAAGVAAGPFVATQVVADLAEFARRPTTKRTFGPDTEVLLGNGSLAGFRLVEGPTPRRELREGVRRLLRSAPKSLRLSFIDLEHLLCEFHRYTAIRGWLAGSRGKPKYTLRSKEAKP